MLQLMNMIPQQEFCEFQGSKAWRLKDYLRGCGCGGIETIFDYTEELRPEYVEAVVGYHLIFYPDWLDFWRGNLAVLNRKFGSPEIWQGFYHGEDQNALINQLRDDLKRAEALKPRYVVFHVSDVSIEEGYTYQWEHSDEEVIDASIELINKLLDGQDYTFEFLVENLHWPGFTFTKPKLTEKLLAGINYKRKGIMLDIGHLMCANLEIKDQSEGCRFVKKMLDEHGELCKYIRGVHLHQSVSGEYVKNSLDSLNRKASEHADTTEHDKASEHEQSTDYYKRFEKSYAHIQRIDTHKPFGNICAGELVRLIDPEYLVHELSAKTLAEKLELTLVQQDAINQII